MLPVLERPHRDVASHMLEQAENTPLRNARDCYLVAQLLAIRGNLRAALPLLPR